MIGIDSIFNFANTLVEKLIQDPNEKAKAQLDIAQLAQNGELQQLATEAKIYEVENTNVSERWKADMSSDSWLSKNIRPLSLIAIFVGFFTFTMMSAFGYNADNDYVQLLGQWGQIIFLAYFGGRTVEKIMDLKSK